MKVKTYTTDLKEDEKKAIQAMLKRKQKGLSINEAFLNALIFGEGRIKVETDLNAQGEAKDGFGTEQAVEKSKTP